MPSNRRKLSEGPGLWIPERPSLGGKQQRGLSDDDRAALAAIASTVSFAKGVQIFRARDKAGHLYLLLQGVVKTYATLPDGSTRGVGFNFPDDLFGSAAEERHALSAEALVPGSLHKIPIPALEAVLRNNAGLGLALIRRLEDRLLDQHRHLLLLGRGDAVGRVAMFIALLERMERVSRSSHAPWLYLPMSRSDIADFVGLSLEAVSRAFTALARDGILKFRAKRHFQVTDRAALQALIDNTPPDAAKPRAKRPRRTAPAPAG